MILPIAGAALVLGLLAWFAFSTGKTKAGVASILILVAMTGAIYLETLPFSQSAEEQKAVLDAKTQFELLQETFRAKQAEVRALSPRQQAQLLVEAYPWEPNAIYRSAEPFVEHKQNWRDKFLGIDYARSMELSREGRNGRGFADAPLVNYVYNDLLLKTRDGTHAERLAAKWSRDGIPSDEQVALVFKLAERCGTEWRNRDRRGSQCAALANAVE